MAVQAIWSGTIGFSLVAIPVSLGTAVEPGRVSFRLLHSKDYSPLARRMVCPKEGKMVPAEEIVRGFEIAPDRFVVVTDEELASVSPERSRTIEIVEFVDRQAIDPIYYDQPYYLVPSKGGEKAYRLLAEVMRRTDKAGLAKFVLAEREYLVALTSRDGALVLTTLRYHQEILPGGERPPAKGTASSDERARMKRSVEKRVRGFDPGKYADERREKLVKLLARKAKEKAPVQAPAAEEEEGGGPADLVAALEESMRKMKEKR
jgi:DNA end-binding protein Ku